jgi:hypothetical protein
MTIIYSESEFKNIIKNNWLMIFFAGIGKNLPVKLMKEVKNPISLKV